MKIFKKYTLRSLGFIVVTACGGEVNPSATKAIDFEQQNVVNMADYIVGEATMVFDSDGSTGVADVKEVKVVFLWDQYKSLMKLEYLNISAPGDVDLKSELFHYRVDDREWRVDLAENQQLAIYNWTGEERLYLLNEQGEITLENISEMYTSVSLFVNHSEVHLSYTDKDAKLIFYDAKSDAEALFLSLTKKPE